jgi:cytochrome c553
MRNIIAGLSTLIVVGLMAYTASQGGAYHGGEHGKVIEDIGNKLSGGAKVEVPKEKSDREKEMDALNALRNKAGNAGAFKVSQSYKSKCSSCHGVNGSGFQNGKPMMGPKLIGKSEEYLYKMLVDFKAGRKENIIMKGLLMPLNDKDFKELSKEIGEFPARLEALKNSK